MPRPATPSSGAALALPLALALLGAGAPAARAQDGGARPLAGDRPDRTESAYTVPAGWLQVEADVATLAGRGSERLLGLGAANLKVGLHRAIDLQLIGTLHERRTVDAGPGPGQGDGRWLPSVTARLKWNLAGNDTGPLAVAALPYVTVPTEGGGGTVAGAVVPVAVALPSGFGLGAMAGGQRAGDGGASMAASASLGRALAPRTGAFVELFGAWDWDGGPGAVLESTLDWGVTFDVSPSLRLDLGAYHGLGGGAEDWRVFTGFAWRRGP